MKRLAGAWCHLLAVTVLVAGIGCMGNIEDESTQNDPVAYAKGGNINYNEVLLVDLGASISAGYTFDPTLVGYDLPPVYSENAHIPRFADYLRGATGHEVDVYNLAIPGWTSTQIVTDELPDALEEMTRYAQGAVVTIEAGGNDLRAFQVEHFAECLYQQPSCFVAIEDMLTTMAGNLSTMMYSVRMATGWQTPIIIQTQYNPMYASSPMPGVSCALAATGDPYAAAGLQQLADFVIGQMNGMIYQVAAGFGAAVADVSGPEYETSDYISTDCTHPAGVQYGIPYLLAPDSVGAGSDLHYTKFVEAYESLQ